MSATSHPERRFDRIASAAAVAAFHALLGYILLMGLGGSPAGSVVETLELFDVALEPPPPAPEPPAPSEAAKKAEGAASPTNLKARASPVAAPEPKIRLKAPKAVAASAEPATGTDPSSGASDKAGPGTGSGDLGTGTGSGRGGSGMGRGGGAVVRAQLVGGRIGDSDYPRSASRSRAGGTVVVRFTVGTDGRPTGCRVTRSSGHADLDATTCRLIEQRFRYRPARDAAGRSVPDELGWKQVWWQEPRGP